VCVLYTCRVLICKRSLEWPSQVDIEQSDDCLATGTDYGTVQYSTCYRHICMYFTICTVCTRYDALPNSRSPGPPHTINCAKPPLYSPRCRPPCGTGKELHRFPPLLFLPPTSPISPIWCPLRAIAPRHLSPPPAHPANDYYLSLPSVPMHPRPWPRSRNTASPELPHPLLL